MLARAILFSVLAGLAWPVAAVTIYKYTDASGVVTYTDQAAPGAQVFTFTDRMVEKLESRVKLETRRHAGGETLVVRNDLHAPVDVQLRFEDLDNVSGVPQGTLRRLVAPRSEVRLISLAPRDPSRPWRYTPKLSHVLGDPDQQPVAYRYPLPWQGGPFRLTQGANGQYSHQTPQGRYAVDIAMPEGTPIIAARSGTVVRVENSQSGRGNNPAGNFVRVLHDDGTMSVYLHLLKGSVVVSEGQRVETGQRLARSGNTGRSTGPHLHFVVQRNLGSAVESIPFEFAQPVDSLPRFAVGGE